MLKKSVIVIASATSLLLAACSADQRYKREVNGDDTYLETPALKPLVAADGVQLPANRGDYYVYTATTQGETGRNVDIRPPSQPIAAIDDSVANYRRGVASLDAPAQPALMPKIVSVLQSMNIPFSGDASSQQLNVGPYFVNRADEEIPYEAAYTVRNTSNGMRQYLTVELSSLSKQTVPVESSIDTQRYTVDFFNMLVIEIKKRDSIDYNAGIVVP
ncbi:outer membrane protein assembly factor BamC [Zophobihabitans entericus]|uniref:Outer membrane protein assembly factor BamC n=1 Tax=Zophobihabitans entericus TaxID=1635327 RepID=A0A6G9IE05_9GAMM|nr:outer membrane protein assembly factor BamC [Zophobihabitans entericus]QIQ21924.1 outer membrane protein assembly factor BamC [Zophobihabitans entericus]